MSEPPTADIKSAGSAEVSTDEDKTQPLSEILNSLNQLKAETNEVRPTLQEDTPVPLQVPISEWDTLRTQLRENPQDPDGWRKLVDLAEDSGDIEKVKETYDGLLEIYPNTSSAQIAYLSHFLNPASLQLAEGLFKRFLMPSPSVDLWKFYLTYVRRLNTGPEARDNIRQAYEFALNHIGQDKDSGDIWNDYIQFVKSGECNTTWDEQQKMDALRKIYNRAVQIPLDNVEKLWHELEAFETGLNRITAKKLMADLSPSHMQARTVLRQLQKHLGPLLPPPPPSSTSRPTIFLPSLPTFNQPERALVGAWKNYLKWEESNPLEIEDKDKATLVTRIQGVYRKALVRMRFYSEIWFMAYVWASSVGKQGEALALLKAGIEANPQSFLLNFAYAELQESRKELADVHAMFDRFLGLLRKDLDALESRVNSANSSFSSNASGAAATADTSLAPAIAEVVIHSNNSSFATQSSEEKPPKSKELEERRTQYGLVWIMYMRFARRAENFKASRAVFGKARKDRWTPWETYEAAALMEYHCNRAVDVASRIFERGLDLFGDEIEYVLRYLGFLISVNDENNARAVFERVITTFPPDRARPLWERWARYEYQYGDLEASQKLEKRIMEVYPGDPPIKRFAQRHIYLGSDAIAARDLGFAVARQTTGPGTKALARTETQQSLLSTTNPPATQAAATKRPASPDYRAKRDESRGPGDYGPSAHKRPRPSPPRDRDRSERWEGPPRRRFGTPPPPAWEREREREVAPLPPRRPERERDDEKGPTLPAVISWFVGQLPAPNAFDGPVFRTDDLMMLFRNAVIPSTSGGIKPRSPPSPGPLRGGGRPPPDYGPYQGPGGGVRGRRY